MRTPGRSAASPTLRASLQDGTYPRPQLARPEWADLNGVWEFAYDDENRGCRDGWDANPEFDRQILVPFPPESTASGIGDRGFHPVVWYHRALTAAELSTPEGSPRTLLHFGAVDYRAEVWLNGIHLGSHEGGHTPFYFDITDAIDRGRGIQSLVVRAEDDPHDVTQPRGKQDWLLDPHEVWYDRTTGIWQQVWLEHVPNLRIADLQWAPDVLRGSVTLTIRLDARPVEAVTATVVVSYEGAELARATAHGVGDRITAIVDLPTQANGQQSEKLLWSPENPRLLDAEVTLSTGDCVASYFGLRTASAAEGVFLLNDRPYYVRSVLSQGFWPASHLAAPSVDALRAEAQLIKDLGFNSTRIHQKIEDPRFLFWADKLGLLVWEEMPSALEFSPEAVRRVTAEWMEAIARDRSHPSIVTWVPLNESWGVQHIAHDPAMQSYASALYRLTKALDPSLPVISNDGWEQVESDVWTIHDYEGDGDVVLSRYADAAARDVLFRGAGPAGRRLRLTDEPDRGQPVMLTEFGGIRFTPGSDADGAWGYTNAQSASDYQCRLESLMRGISVSSFLAGYCYTQLTDTQQEANGLCDENRVPKLPLDQLRVIFG